MANQNLHDAKRAKKDEFYTQLSDIENELKHYKHHFKGKVVFCNCDDPYESNFFKYFANNFNYLGLKKLIVTCFNGSPISGTELPLFEDDAEPERIAYKVEITEISDVNGDGRVDLADVEHLIKNKKNVLTKLEGNGDFRSEECIKLLKEADIVVTNPPFSLFRDYVDQLVLYNKKFLILGNMNAITYKELFPLIKNNKMWIGYGFNLSLVYRTPYKNDLDSNRAFVRQRGYNPDEYIKVPAIAWFTNLDHKKRHEELILYKKYSPNDYRKYDNYDAINVDKVSEIPCDYDGVMGVPITFLDKYNPEQFEIVEFRKGADGKDLVYSVREERRGEERRDSRLFNHTSEYSSVDADSRINEQSQRYCGTRQKQICENTYSKTSIPGMIKNAEGKINGKITYARITIRRIKK